MPATVERLEYDPNRTAFIALVKYEDGTQAYILAPQRLGVGDTIVAGKKTDVKPGNAMELSQMPVGTKIGRAWGRASGCQYGSMSVVAGALKKKELIECSP